MFIDDDDWSERAKVIASKITQEQREWFLSTTMTVDGRALGDIAKFALPDATVRYYSAKRDVLTDLGLALRKYLIDGN